MIKIQRFFSVILISSLLILFTSAQIYSQQKLIPKGTVERINVYGKGLEGNLEGDSANPSVFVYLPASYKKNPRRRYPVIYFLHGYTDNAAKVFGFSKHWMNMVPILDSVFAEGGAKEMIVVTPNAYSRYQGSMYSNSVTTGNWEDYIAKELVSYIDTHYRTIAKAESRGLSGHSMGGYGSLRIGERHPEVFTSIYALSPCCLTSGFNIVQVPASYLRADSIKTFAEFEKADFGAKAAFASAAAWSPNPTLPPFYVDLPVKNGELQPAVLAKWAGNSPIFTLDQYISNLKELRAIAFDAGNRDQGISSTIKILDEQLNNYGVKHFFEIYEGDHISGVAERIEKKMLVFFSDNLSFIQTKDR